MRKNDGARAKTSMSKSVAAARSTRAAASPLQQTAETAAVFSPEGVTPEILRTRN
jgi:hypothetical protein